jgi:hypothetical protein
MTISSSAPVAVFFLFVGMSAASLQAQSVTGRVIDHTTGVGVPSAAIAVVDRTGARVGVAYSDSLGRFLVALDAGGTLRVEVGQLGYLPAILLELAVPESGTIDLRVELPPSPINIRGVDAVASPTPDTRRTATAVAALSRAQVDALLPASDVIRLVQALPTAGLRVFEYQRDPGSPIYDLCVEGTRRRTPIEQGCRWVAVFIDGAKMAAPEEGLRFLAPDEIDRMEFIPASVAGARWGTGSQDGVLLITTRR